MLLAIHNYIKPHKKPIKTGKNWKKWRFFKIFGGHIGSAILDCAIFNHKSYISSFRAHAIWFLTSKSIKDKKTIKILKKQKKSIFENLAAILDLYDTYIFNMKIIIGISMGRSRKFSKGGANLNLPIPLRNWTYLD